jgi:hydroxymethylpyrimidine/phosphomethylpyrimidine kinase
MKGRVLIVAGSDSGGGAGIQADIKTVTALGGFAMTAITALTAQNTLGVIDVSPVDVEFIQTQMRVVLDDLGADCLKTGMLHSSEVIEAVCAVAESEAAGIPLVVDPVMVAKGGATLLGIEAVAAMRDRLLPMARVITPNIPEAETLLGMEIGTLDAMKRAAELMMEMGAAAVLIKGGHMSGRVLTDVLLDDGGFHLFETERVDTEHTHGTGCTMASAIAAGLAQDMPLPEAVGRAQAYVAAAIRGAPGYGQGHGPIDHGHTVSSFGTG